MLGLYVNVFDSLYILGFLYYSVFVVFLIKIFWLKIGKENVLI